MTLGDAIIVALVSGMMSMLALSLTQIILKLVIEPYQEFISLLPEIRSSLKYHYNTITCGIPGLLDKSRTLTAANEIRSYSGKLESVFSKLPWYNQFVICAEKFGKKLPDCKEIDSASTKLIYLSNAIPQGPHPGPKNSDVVNSLLNELHQKQI
jgi:hypothetical protein